MLRCSVEEDGEEEDVDRGLSLDALSFERFSGARAEASVAFSQDRGEERAVILERQALRDGVTQDGPCVVVEYSGTTVIPAGWRLYVVRQHLLIVRLESEGGET